MLNNETNGRRPLMLSENSELLLQKLLQPIEPGYDMDGYDEATRMPPYVDQPVKADPVDMTKLTTTIKPSK